MDCSHDEKRLNFEDDIFSSLPVELIHRILAFIDIRDAIRTSVLSSRWRYIWTSMPYLNFSTLPKISKFITHFLAGRNNQTEVSSVNLNIDGKNSDVFVEQITMYAFSHNIQQLNVACLFDNDVEFPLFLFRSRSLKHLSLTKEDFAPYLKRFSKSYLFKVTFPWELPALTTLYLDKVTLCCDENANNSVTVFSKCANLKNLTLKGCYTTGFKGFGICLPLLCSLKLDNVCGSVKVFYIVAPQLKNLTIRGLRFQDHQYLISAPDLIHLLYEGYNCLQLSTNGFNFLEKADICVSIPRDAYQIIHLLQDLHNVKFLTLNLEIVELLSSSAERMLQQPSPFVNLKSLKIHPELELLEVRERERVKMSAEVESYLLDSSPSATFTMITREDIRAVKNTKMAEILITKLKASLEKEKASTKTKMAKMHELPKPQVDKHIDTRIHWYIERCWKCMSLQIEKEKEKASDIISMLKEIEDLLEELPASNRGTIQPSFSRLCAEADIVMSKITDSMKMNCDENQRHVSACFRELATKVHPSS